MFLGDVYPFFCTDLPHSSDLFGILIMVSISIYEFRFDLEMEFKPLSKKIVSARIGAKVRCEFIKEGRAE